MEKAKVVITGAGMVTPLGETAAQTRSNWLAGQSAETARVGEFDGTSLEGIVTAVMPEIDAAKRLGSRKMLKYMSEAAKLGCIAAHEAAADADISSRFEPERIGLYASVGLAAVSIKEAIPVINASMDEGGVFSTRLLGEKGLPATNPLLSFKMLANMPPCIVSIIECIKGPNLIFTPWEGQTGAALREAWSAVAGGEVDCALAGASDNAAHPSTIVYLKKTGLLRETEFPAAGAAYVVMERAESALRDRRRAYAQVQGTGLSACEEEPCDPLANRIGRTFAAAPAILLALASMLPDVEVSICGVDRQKFRAQLEVAS